MLSGDLVDRADEDDVYGYFLDRFLQPVLRAANLGESRVIVTAGNHDIPRSFVEKERERHDEFIQTLSSREMLNAAYEDGRLSEFVSRKFEKFNDIRDMLGVRPSHESPFGTVAEYAELGLSLVELNSAWMGLSGIDKISDVHKLLIPEAAVADALTAVDTGLATLLVSHHPFDWLSDFARTDVEATINGRAVAHLFGHMHLPRPEFGRSPFGDRYAHQGGAVFTDRKFYQGYALVQLDTATTSMAVHLRSYYDRRRAFDVATDVLDSPNAIFFPNEQSKKHFQNAMVAVDRGALRGWCASELLGSMTTKFGEGITDRDVNDVFVAPPMYSEVEIKTKDDEQPQVIEKDLAFEAMVASRENYLIYGKPEYGKTTLLQQMATRIVKTQGDAPVVPVVLSFSDVREGTDRVEAQIRSELPQMPDGCAVKRILNEGLATVLVDDVNFSDRKRCAVLLDFVKTYPRCRFLFTTTLRGANVLGMAVDLEAVVHFEQAFIKPMRRKDVRMLVGKWDRENAIDQDAVLERLIQDMGTMSLPLTPLNTSILLSIFEGTSNFAPINKTSLIERFVEVLLDKADVGEVTRRSFDFKNKTHYLSSLAAHMAEVDLYIFSEVDLLKFTDSYLQEMGLEQDVSQLLNAMVDARILQRRPDGKISFRYRAFLEYYIAQAMATNRQFREWVLTEERYLSFVNEIQYYSGINRDDADLLEMVGARFAALDDGVFAEIGPRPDLRQLDAFSLPRSEDDTGKILRSVEDGISAPPLTEEERDEILEAELPQDVEGRQEVFRPNPTDAGQQWLTALIIYSNVLRGTELINDGAKRTHLARVLEGWGSVMHLTLWQIPKVAEQRYFVVNGVRYEVRLPSGLTDGDAARLLFMHIPNAVAELAYSSAGTEKLSRQLALADGEPTAISFLRTD